MNKLTVVELLDITKGKLIAGDLDRKIQCFSIDTRTLDKGGFFIALKGNRFDGHHFIEEAFEKGAGGVIIDNNLCVKRTWEFLRKKKHKGVIIQVDDSVKCLGAIAGYWRKQFEIPLVAITGSNGKTTTKDMAVELLADKFNVLGTKGNFNNHIGVPLTLLELSSKHGVICMEMGTNAQGEIAYLSNIASPINVAVITNIQRAHLEQFRDLEGVLKAKMELAGALSVESVLVVNLDDEQLAQASASVGCRVLSYGIKNKMADIVASAINAGEAGINFMVSVRQKDDVITEQMSLPVLGYHNVYNALGAIAVCNIFGIPLNACSRRLSQFKMPSLHMEVTEIKGMKVINDAYNANPDSTTRAIATLSSFSNTGRKIAVIGDMLELGEKGKQLHEEIGEYISKTDIGMVFATGEMAEHVAKGAIKSGFSKDNVFVMKDKKDIAEKLLRQARKGDIILIKGSRAMKMETIVELLKNG
ncbi:MAG: UDP-N-acetylmuramoyl-tripeptide--D-alanyl-D-alanine ligase [bacterium]